MDCEARRPRWCAAPLRSVRFLATRFPATAFFVVAALVGFGAKCCADQHEDCTATQCYPWLTCESYTDAESQPAKTCEIECTDNTDCPCGQTCVDMTPGPGLVCMECAGEGIATDDPATCCAGLAAMSACLPGDVDCEGGYFCTACGDGVCGEHESPWECPADCADCAALDIDAATCAKGMVDYWVAEKRRQTAAELAAMPFADRAEAIADRAWYGRVPGTAYTEMHDDGAVDLLLGLRLTPEMLGLADVAAGGSAADLADAFVARHGATLLGLGTEHGTLSRRTRGSEGRTVFYLQSFGGVQVVGGALYLTFDEDLALVEIGNRLLPEISHGTTPDISIEDALVAIGRYTGVPAPTTVRSGLFIYPGDVRRVESRLVYEIIAADPQTQTEIGAFQVDAITGDIRGEHDAEWIWPYSGGPLPLPGDAHHVTIHLVGMSYKEACEDPEGGYYDLTGSNYDVGIATNVYSAEESLVWYGGDAFFYPDNELIDAHVWDYGDLYSTADMIEEVLWPFAQEKGYDADGVLGSSGAPMRMWAKANMAAQTVAFKSNNGHLYFVEGAVNLGTFPHEFCHRAVDPAYGGFETQPMDDIEEGRCDSFSEAFKGLYRHRYEEEHSDTLPDTLQAPLCYDADGNPVDPWTHNCFNTYNEDLGLVTHQNLQVQTLGQKTRCAAIQQLKLADFEADESENVWRSKSDPLALNHGHGRGAATYDHLIGADGKEFQYGVWGQATNANASDTQPYREAYCEESEPDFDKQCDCGTDYGEDHTNNGIQNRFFYDLGYSYGFPNPHQLNGDGEVVARKQLALLHSLYDGVYLGSHTQWAEKIREVVESEGAGSDDPDIDSFSDGDWNKVASSLRETGIFTNAGTAAQTFSDLEAVPVWADADDQRLFIFHRAADEAGETVLPREVGYSIYDLSGASGSAELVADCALPDVPTPDGDEAPVSGFAPTAVKLDDRIWVAWVQYDATQPSQKFGHLAYATLQPNLTSKEGCGSWSDVVYDPATEVHGSLRSTLVDRGFVWNGFTWIDCPNPPCYDWPFDDWMAYVNPPDFATLGMLENLGFDLDDIQDGAMGGSAPPPPQEDVDNAIEALRSLATTDGLGVSRQPTSRDARAPQSADMSIELNMRELYVGLKKASASAPEITEALAALLPNTVSFLDGLSASPAPIGVRMSLWEPPPPPPEVGGGLEVGALLEVPLLSVSTVAVSFLGEEQGTDGRRHAIVREYGATEDPFEPIDHLVGYATYTPGLATVGQTEPEGSGFISIVRDNVVACSDFTYSSLNADEVGRMSCMVFLNGDFTPTVGGIRKLKPGDETENVGISIDISTAPRLTNAGDVVYITYRISGSISDAMRYIAMRGPEFEPVTFNSVMSGLEFPTSFDGPRKLLANRKLEIEVPLQPIAPDSSRWPVFPGSWWSTEYGGVGYTGVGTVLPEDPPDPDFVTEEEDYDDPNDELVMTRMYTRGIAGW